MAALDRLRQRPIAATEKGFGLLASGAGPVTAGSLAAERPPALDATFTLPILLVRDSALSRNTAAMAAWCARAGVSLAPHGKTTMAPQIFARQLAAGAWGLTAATIAQAQVYRAFGIDRILIANELTDPAGIRWLGRELAADPEFECYAYADSVAGVRMLDAGLAVAENGLAASDTVPRRLKILVELGFRSGRTGCRDRETALEVAAAVAASDRLALAGAAGYEGGLGNDQAPATLDAVAAYCGRLAALATELRDQYERHRAAASAGDWIVSAGGSLYFDIVARELAPTGRGHGLAVVLRSGCYITHDHGGYAENGPGADRGGPELTAALELWAPVLSVPEPGLALALAGRRDVGSDQGYPIPLRIRAASGDPATERAADGLAVTALNDQHAYLRLPPQVALSPGDLLCLGISHPCTTLDKWRVIPVADDDYQVIDVIHTFF